MSEELESLSSVKGDGLLVSALSIDEIQNLTLDEINQINSNQFSLMSKEQIYALPALPIELRIAIAMTPPEAVVRSFATTNLKKYPPAYAASLTVAQLDLLSPEQRGDLNPQIDLGIIMLEKIKN